MVLVICFGFGLRGLQGFFCWLGLWFCELAGIVAGLLRWVFAFLCGLLIVLYLLIL